MSRHPNPVTTFDLFKWTLLTLRRDWRQYKGASRPLTWPRVKKSLSPNVRRPVFLIGTPRSGTSFLGRCIEALPGFSYHFEPMATKSAVKYVYTGAWTNAEAEGFYRLFYRNLLRLHLDGDLRFAEKTPRNCFAIPFLRQIFPGAQFVFIVRDGRDAALSHSKKPWLQDDGDTSLFNTGSHRFGVYPRFWVEPDRREEFRTTSTFHRCVWAWRRHAEAALEALEEVPEAVQCRLRYESFVRHPSREMNRLLDMLEVTDGKARQAAQAVAAEAHTGSVGAWRDELTMEKREVARAEAGPLLDRLGYSEEEASVS